MGEYRATARVRPYAHMHADTRALCAHTQGRGLPPQTRSLPVILLLLNDCQRGLQPLQTILPQAA